MCLYEVRVLFPFCPQNPTQQHLLTPMGITEVFCFSDIEITLKRAQGWPCTSEEMPQLQSQSCLAPGPSRIQLSKQEVVSAPSSESHPTTGHQPAAAPPAAFGNGLMFLLWSYPPGQLHTLQNSNIHSSPCRLSHYFKGRARKGKKSTWLTICRLIFNTQDIFCFHLQHNTTLKMENRAPHTSCQEQITQNILKYKVTCMDSAPWS